MASCTHRRGIICHASAFSCSHSLLLCNLAAVASAVSYPATKTCPSLAHPRSQKAACQAAQAECDKKPLNATAPKGGYDVIKGAYLGALTSEQCSAGVLASCKAVGGCAPSV